MNRKQRRSATKGQVSREAESLLATARSLHAAGRRGEAEAVYREALGADGRNTVAMVGLAALKYEDGDLQEASRILNKALRLAPRSPDAHHLLGVVLAADNRNDEAIEHFRRTLRHEPDNLNCVMRLGTSLAAEARYSEAADCFQRVAAAEPENGTAFNNLGLALLNLNRFGDAVSALERAVTLRPGERLWQSNYLMCLNYDPAISPGQLFEAHLRAGRAFRHDRGPHRGSTVADPESGHRLRVGFVSPDFKSHSVAYFFEPLLAALDRQSVETFLYAEVARPDETTARLHELADHWCSTVGSSDDQVADRIRQDRVDILVDMAGHTRGNRLGVFARRVAPVQVTWLGYGYTTGLEEMDFRITDAFCDPPGESDSLATEALYRMPDGFLCYRSDPTAPDVSDPPCQSRDYVTFGSFNYPSKINEGVVALWARVMERVPGSRVLLKTRSLADPVLRTRMLGWFEAHGIDGSRVELREWSRTTSDHFAAYADMDIALDSFPYNGTTTTCEALWMGVPVVTKAGDRHVSRVAGSLLHQIGLADLVAADEEEYIAVASSLAGDADRLMALRRGLRDRMRASSLMDGQGFARRMEDAFHQMVRLKSASPAVA